MRKGRLRTCAVGLAGPVIVAAGILVVENEGQAQQQRGSGADGAADVRRVVSVRTILGRPVYDARGRRLAVLEDVVIARPGGAVLAVLALDEYTDAGGPDLVAVPAERLRLPGRGEVWLDTGGVSLAALPPVRRPGETDGPVNTGEIPGGLLVPAPTEEPSIRPQSAERPSGAEDVAPLPRYHIPDIIRIRPRRGDTIDGTFFRDNLQARER